MGLGVWGLGFGVWGLGLGAWGLGLLGGTWDGITPAEFEAGCGTLQFGYIPLQGEVESGVGV